MLFAHFATSTLDHTYIRQYKRTNVARRRRRCDESEQESSDAPSKDLCHFIAQRVVPSFMEVSGTDIPQESVVVMRCVRCFAHQIWLKSVKKMLGFIADEC